MSTAESFAVVLTGLLLVSPLLAPAAADPGGELPHSMSDDHFVVKYDDGYEASAETTLKHLQEIRTELQAATPVDTTMSGKITVRIHPIDEWEDSRYSLHWHNNPNRINLIAPSDWRTVEHIDKYYVKKNLAHEYANILLYEHVESHSGDYWNRYPSWFGEGLSEYYAYHNVSGDVEANYDPGVNEFERKVREGSGYFAVLAEDRYSGGHLLMHYVMDEYGDEAVFQMLRSDAGTFDAIVESELGMSYDVFKKRWLLWAETNIGGNYSVSEDGVSKAQRIASLEDHLQRKNETIAAYRDRLDERNETIAELREEVETLNRTLQQSRESSPAGNDESENETHDEVTTTSGGDPRTSSEAFFAGAAGGGLLTLVAVGVVFRLRG